ncbi:Regulatory protein (induces abgABT, used to catabolize p-aminobenzoyl-glutamate) [Klebsiella pneumoniae]|nr:Regulatory protein (induces abgABT, used to catabolize p-aminobenzoyl-glutamate) [Klebsiella pneumoniae]
MELGNDPLMADKLVMIPIREVLPTATYYLIQRRDTRQTPLTASLITPVPPPEPTIVSLIVRRAHFASERG